MTLKCVTNIIFLNKYLSYTSLALIFFQNENSPYKFSSIFSLELFSKNIKLKKNNFKT